VFWLETAPGGSWVPNVSSVSLRRSSIVADGATQRMRRQTARGGPLKWGG
jgi:hypothetical protein